MGYLYFQRENLKGIFNSIYLTQFVLSFNSYESFLCASPDLGIKNIAVHIIAPNSCAHRVHLAGRAGGGRQQESSNINRMLDGRLAYQKESQAGRGRRCGGLGGGGAGQGVGGEEPCCSSAELQVQSQTPRYLKVGRQNRYVTEEVGPHLTLALLISGTTGPRGAGHGGRGQCSPL